MGGGLFSVVKFELAQGKSVAFAMRGLCHVCVPLPRNFAVNYMASLDFYSILLWYTLQRTLVRHCVLMR